MNSDIRYLRGLDADRDDGTRDRSRSELPTRRPSILVRRNTDVAGLAANVELDLLGRKREPEAARLQVGFLRRPELDGASLFLDERGERGTFGGGEDAVGNGDDLRSALERFCIQAHLAALGGRAGDESDGVREAEAELAAVLEDRPSEVRSTKLE